MSDFKDADLLITIGTSLKVHPFASLIDRASDDCPRLLINLESVGEIDEEEAYGGGTMFGRYREDGFDFNGLASGGKQFARDVRWLGEADKGVRELAQLLGWEEELDKLYEQGHAELDRVEKQENSEAAGAAPAAPALAPQTDAAAKAEEAAEKVAEAARQPADPKQVEDAQKRNEQAFDKLAEEMDKLGVQSAGNAEKTLNDVRLAEAVKEHADDTSKKPSL